MKTTLYYFSATGNSLKIARDLAVELDSAVVVPIIKAGRCPSLELHEDSIGFIFPVYCGTVPAIVKEFIHKVTFDRNAYIFGVVNCNAIPRNVLFDLDQLLKNKGGSLAAGFVIDMPGNFIPMIPNTPEDIAVSRFKEQSNLVKKIAGIVKDRQHAGIEGRYSRFDSFLGKAQAIFIKHVYRTGKKFWVNGKCNECGICEKVCPRGNIRMTKGSVCWGDNCEQCMACLHWCPQEVIQNGKNTLSRLRYHHPDIKVRDILDQK